MWRSLCILSLLVATILATQCNNQDACNGNGICFGTDHASTCSCFEGFVGARCAVKVGEISQRSVETPCDPSVACNGHGTCSGPADAASCMCAPGYFGARCQIPMRNVLVRRALESRQLPTAPCDAAVACNGNGACSGTINDSSCICNVGFIGARCQISLKH